MSIKQFDGILSGAGATRPKVRGGFRVNDTTASATGTAAAAGAAGVAAIVADTVTTGVSKQDTSKGSQGTGVNSSFAVVPASNPVAPSEVVNGDGVNRPSLQHLEAPLNAAINGWLEGNQPLVSQLFKMTGLQPIDLVNAIVKRFHNSGVAPTREAVNAAALDVIDGAENRAQLITQDQIITQSAGEEIVTNPREEHYVNLQTAVATVRLAARTLPGGIHALMQLRAALQLQPDVFVKACEATYGFNPEEVLSDRIQDASETLTLRPRGNW